MAFDEFRCVVVGNEPAGLWLLSALEKAYRAVGEEPRLAWICLDGEPSPVCLPTLFNQPLGIPPGAPWSAEIVTPEGSLPWTAKVLADRFKELPAVDPGRDPVESLLTPTSAEMAAIRTAIARHPELIAYAQGLWKFVGRSQTQSPEQGVHMARYLTNLQWWSPEKELGKSVEKISLSCLENEIESVRSHRREGLSLQFRGGTEIRSPHWILNSGVRTVQTLGAKCPAFRNLLNIQGEPARLRGLYPLRLKVEADAIPAPVQPLTLSFDTDLIPDPQTEIWPITLKAAENLRELTVWASAPGLVSLESTLEAFRQGMQRVQRLFPFLSQKLVQIPIPLGMDSCFDEQERHRVTDLLQCVSVEQYHHTGVNTDTRSAFMTLLPPYVGCQLPYPVGSLLAARKLVPQIVGKKKKPPTTLDGIHAPS